MKGISDATSVLPDRGSGVYGYCATLAHGRVACWGNSGDRTSNVPRAISGLAGVTDLASDGTGYCAVVDGGSVRCWGHDDEGELGDVAG